MGVVVCRFAVRLFSAVCLGSPVSCCGHLFVVVRESGVDGGGTGPPETRGHMRTHRRPGPTERLVPAHTGQHSEAVN